MVDDVYLKEIVMFVGWDVYVNYIHDLFRLDDLEIVQYSMNLYGDGFQMEMEKDTAALRRSGGGTALWGCRDVSGSGCHSDRQRDRDPPEMEAWQTSRSWGCVLHMQQVYLVCGINRVRESGLHMTEYLCLETPAECPDIFHPAHHQACWSLQ